MIYSYQLFWQSFMKIFWQSYTKINLSRKSFEFSVRIVTLKIIFNNTWTTSQKNTILLHNNKIGSDQQACTHRLIGIFVIPLKE